MDEMKSFIDTMTGHDDDAAANIARIASELIENAPEHNAPQESFKRATGGIALRESWGWGKRYCEKIELHGEEWLKAFSEALPVIASGGIVAMVGDRGPGKTQMAAEIARGGGWQADQAVYVRNDAGGITHRDKTALYRRAMDIFLDLREASKNHVKSSEKEVLAKLANVGLLVIDEFQERGESEWENRIMKNLIDKRYSAERPTIIIANLPRKELFAALGESIVDRARENGKSIEFSWPSYRQPK